MDINQIEINTNSLRKDIRDLETDCSSLLDDVKKLESLLDELNSMWKGTANSAFNSQYISDCNYLRKIIGELRRYTNQMVDAGTEYDRCETTVNDIVQAIRI